MKLIGKIWRKMPRSWRMLITRASQKKFTVSVVGIITNSEGKVLILDHVLRAGSGWGLPGGFIEYREQPYEAISREIAEETGLSITNIQLKTVRTFKRHVEIIFSARSEGMPEVRSIEITQAIWVEIDALPKEMNADQQFLIAKILDAKFENEGFEV